MQNSETRQRSLILFFILSLMNPVPGFSQREWIGPSGEWLQKKDSPWHFGGEFYESTDYVMADNGLDLNNKNNDDSFEYIGIDYHLNLSLDYEDQLKLFTRFERNGPGDYGSPVLGRRRVRTAFGDVEKYERSDLLPELEEFYSDLEIPGLGNQLRFKLGLFPLSIGNGFSGSGYYESYGFTLYHAAPVWSWQFAYQKPDWNNDLILGPDIDQEERLGRGYQHSQAGFFPV